MLESLVSRNIFTVKTSDGFYRYHALFRSGLLEAGDKDQIPLLRRKAARYYFDRKQYSRAARYAIELKDSEYLGKIILACYRDYIKAGNYNELRLWFQALGDTAAGLNPDIFVAKGAFLSIIGNFVEARNCLETAFPLINANDEALYYEAMIHKARVLRNFVSFEESDRLLDELIGKLDNFTGELEYSVVIEKLYNLCWDSQIG
jgi:LuxR family maltose regulon positive regulatory protein